MQCGAHIKEETVSFLRIHVVARVDGNVGYTACGDSFQIDKKSELLVTSEPTTCRDCREVAPHLPNVRHRGDPLVHRRYYTPRYGTFDPKWTMCHRHAGFEAEAWTSEPATCLECLGVLW